MQCFCVSACLDVSGCFLVIIVASAWSWLVIQWVNEYSGGWAERLVRQDGTAPAHRAMCLVGSGRISQLALGGPLLIERAEVGERGAWCAGRRRPLLAGRLDRFSKSCVGA